MSASTSNENTGCRAKLTVPYLKIRLIQCNEKISGTIVAATGLVTSLWTNTIFIIGCKSDDYRFQEQLIILSCQITHLIVILTALSGYTLAIKEKKRTYFLPWIYIKIIEMVLLFIGCVLLPITGPYIGLMPIGIIILLITGYITLAVWDTYKKLPGDETQSMDFVEVTLPAAPKPTSQSSFDNFTNQTQT